MPFIRSATSWTVELTSGVIGRTLLYAAEASVFAIAGSAPLRSTMASAYASWCVLVHFSAVPSRFRKSPSAAFFAGSARAFSEAPMKP
jgi:hypothetical protein